jgi:uncharacterized protein YkwD
MKPILILGASLLASTALATPIQKRDDAATTEWTQEVVYETVTITIDSDISSPTPESATESPSSSPSPTSNAQPDQQSQPQQSSPSQSSPPAASSISSDYAQGLLDAHNNHRANHSAPPLAWSNELADTARQIAQSCVYAHNMNTNGGGYGQNIGAGAPRDQAPKMITDNMYNDEIGYYPGYGSEPNMDDFHHWGHFSQIVWKGTEKVGCETVYCPGGLANTGSNVSPWFMVCNYSPAGNMAGQYAANVQQPIGMATVNI